MLFPFLPYLCFNAAVKGQLLKLEDLESAIDAIVSEHYLIVLINGKQMVLSVSPMADPSLEVLSI